MANHVVERFGMCLEPEHLYSCRADIRIRVFKKLDQVWENLRTGDFLHGKDRLDPLSALVGVKVFQYLVEFLAGFKPFQDSCCSFAEEAKSEVHIKSTKRLTSRKQQTR
jgi:hypothetical protein